MTCPHCAPLLAGLVDLFKMMDEGLLVRDVSTDLKGEYLIKAMGFVMRLKEAHQAAINAGADI